MERDTTFLEGLGIFFLYALCLALSPVIGLIILILLPFGLGATVWDWLKGLTKGGQDGKDK